MAEWLADGLLELVEGDGEGDGDGDGDRVGDREGDGDGEGVGVLEAGSAWHTVSVLAVVGMGAACALPSTPRVRKLPLSKVTAATLTCAKRIRIACLRCSSGLPCALRDSEATRDRMGMGTHIPSQATYASPCHLRITARGPGARLPGRLAVFTRVITDLTARGPDRFRDAHHGPRISSVSFLLRTVVPGAQLSVPVDTGPARVLCCPMPAITSQPERSGLGRRRRLVGLHLGRGDLGRPGGLRPGQRDDAPEVADQAVPVPAASYAAAPEPSWGQILATTVRLWVSRRRPGASLGRPGGAAPLVRRCPPVVRRCRPR